LEKGRNLITRRKKKAWSRRKAFCKALLFRGVKSRRVDSQAKGI